MKPKNILVFGATGQIGRNLIRKLTKKNYKVTAVTRNLHKKGSTIYLPLFVPQPHVKFWGIYLGGFLNQIVSVLCLAGL